MTTLHGLGLGWGLGLGLRLGLGLWGCWAGLRRGRRTSLLRGVDDRIDAPRAGACEAVHRQPLVGPSELREDHGDAAPDGLRPVKHRARRDEDDLLALGRAVRGEGGAPQIDRRGGAAGMDQLHSVQAASPFGGRRRHPLASGGAVLAMFVSSISFLENGCTVLVKAVCS